MQPYIAHVDQKSGRTQSMTEHAENVAELSARFAAPLCLAQTARLIALVHDMGKGTPPFQAYLTEDEKKKTHFHAPAAQFSPMSAGFPAMKRAGALRRSSPCAYTVTTQG